MSINDSITSPTIYDIAYREMMYYVKGYLNASGFGGWEKVLVEEHGNYVYTTIQLNTRNEPAAILDLDITEGLIQHFTKDETMTYVFDICSWDGKV